MLLKSCCSWFAGAESPLTKACFWGFESRLLLELCCAETASTLTETCFPGFQFVPLMELYCTESVLVHDNCWGRELISRPVFFQRRIRF
jgi:hypothetical protein